jgi:hypothetical protein
MSDSIRRPDIYEGHSPNCHAVHPGDRECNCHLAYGFSTAQEMDEAKDKEVEMNNKYQDGQEVLGANNGSAICGFNRRLDSPDLTEAFKYPHEWKNGSMVAGWELADKMIAEGKLYFKHNFHYLDCPRGHAFMYGGTMACNTCNTDSFQKEWWKIKVFKDGSDWCCIGTGFENLQESDNFAFGDTRAEAIDKYGKLMHSMEQTQSQTAKE